MRATKARATILDGAIGGLAFAISVTIANGAPLTDPELRGPDAAAYALLGAYSLSILGRRRAPGVATAVGLLTGMLYAAAKYPPALTPVVLLSVYSAAAALEPRRSRGLLAGAVVVATLGATFSPGPTQMTIPVLVAVAWLVGHQVQSRREYVAELEHQNELLRTVQDALARQAVVSERMRIARELHDVVAHSMAIVAVHAGSGRLVARTDPAAAEAALSTIESTTRTALTEMRTLLGALRGSEEDPQLGPVPGLADVDTLVRDIRRSGQRVAMTVGGTPRPLGAGVQLTVYRVVQEALTNVMKHAPGAAALVHVEYERDGVCVRVEDDGPGPASDPAATRSAGGHGLAGIRERVALHGGRAAMGPRADRPRGFVVEVHVPARDEDR